MLRTRLQRCSNCAHGLRRLFRHRPAAAGRSTFSKVRRLAADTAASTEEAEKHVPRARAATTSLATQPKAYGRGGGVGRGLGVGMGLGPGVAVGVGVAVAVGVGDAVPHGWYSTTSSTHIPVVSPGGLKPSWCTKNLIHTVCPAYDVMSTTSLVQSEVSHTWKIVCRMFPLLSVI